MRIYVADLAAYNSGTLYGAWVDVSQFAEQMESEIEEMLSKSPVGGEEWAIHDYEDFPNMGENPPLSDIEAAFDLVEKYGYFPTNYALEHEGNDPGSAEQFLEENYLGLAESFGGEVEAVANYYAESGMYESEDLPDWASDQYDSILRDKARSDLNGGVVWTEYDGNGRYHIFTH